MQDERIIQIDQIQAREYAFPYHYLPSVGGFPNFSKVWDFSASYIAAIHLFADWLSAANKSDGTHLHMDYGCGDGGFLYQVQALGLFDDVEFWGIDFDAHAIAWARQFAVQDRFIAGDIADLSQSQYDSGSLVEVYEHIPPQECPRFITNIANSLKPDAPLFVTVPSVEKKIPAKHYRHFDFATLIAEFGGEFTVEEIFGFERNNYFSRRLTRLLKNRSWVVETKRTNRYLVNKLRAKHSQIDGCGRIGLVLRKK